MSIPLTLHGRPVTTVFELLGSTENDLTFSLGWALANAPNFTAAVLQEVLGNWAGPASSVSLQESGSDRGFTDVEVRSPTSHLIMEAKRGWNLPGEEQLARYAPRLAKGRGALLVVSECSRRYADLHLPKSVEGVRVEFRSWRQVTSIVERSIRTSPRREQSVLREVQRYLRGVMTMQTLDSNWTYCVSLNQRRPEGWPLSTVEFVRERGMYFCPYAAPRWPKTPQNYLAFRWSGHVQDVRHVETYQIVEELNEVIPEIPAQNHSFLQIVYRLGPPIPLSAPLPNGAQYRSSRVWVPLDLLLTASTLADALALKLERLADAPAEPA